ncbi:MAG: hypothetical protein ACREQL_09470, partial [Candidatus Binatia bacterium]
MSSELSALLSVAYHEPGDEHLVELVHQQDPAAPRRLASLALDVYASDGRHLYRVDVDPELEVLDLGEALAKHAGITDRLMVTFDTRYDERIFQHRRPHHYAFVHRRGSAAPPVYYAVNSVLGGFARRTDAVRLHNFETYLFVRRVLPQRYSLLLGNPSRFAQAEAQVVTHFGTERRTREVTIAPRAHVEVDLESAVGGEPLRRVELKSLFRLANYVV